MYSRILVPLDTSDLAEQALAHAGEVARRFRAEVQLVTVIRASREEVEAVGDFDPHTHEAREYLDGIAARLQQDGLAVSTALRRGDVAEEIIAQAAQSRSNLIVICTHGRSGLGRWVYGSIADRLLRYSPVPVLLVRATKP